MKYYRILEHPVHPGDTFPGYQPEEITVIGDRVVDRKLIDKPNMFEYAQTHVVDLMDPRNVLRPDKSEQTGEKPAEAAP